MFGALLLFEDEFIHVVSISFTALIITELLMVALTIRDDDTIHSIESQQTSQKTLKCLHRVSRTG